MLGEPLLVHIARAALACAEVDDVYFATDDDIDFSPVVTALVFLPDQKLLLTGDDSSIKQRMRPRQNESLLWLGNKQRRHD